MVGRRLLDGYSPSCLIAAISWWLGECELTGNNNRSLAALCDGLHGRAQNLAEFEQRVLAALTAAEERIRGAEVEEPLDEQSCAGIVIEQLSQANIDYIHPMDAYKWLQKPKGERPAVGALFSVSYNWLKECH